MRYIHIFAGLIALVSGFIAIGAPKGHALHKLGGKVFAASMLVMTSMGALLASWSPDPGSKISVVAGLLGYYLVCTSFVTVHKPLDQVRALTTALMALGAFTGAYAYSLGFAAADAASGRIDGVPAGVYFGFGTIPLLCAAFDARMLRAGSIQGPSRLIRHLGRMGGAMFIASGSFFLGQAKLFPDPIRKSGLLTLPVLFVIGMTLYWLVRMLRQKRRARRRAIPAGAALAHAMVPGE